jgi:hypothetical protein
MKSKNFFILSSLLLWACPAEQADLRGTSGTSGTSEASEYQDDAPVASLDRCPNDEVPLKDGTCAHVDDFLKEQETLDEEVLVKIQQAEDPAEAVAAKLEFYEQQIQQTQQMEDDLDEILETLKKQKNLEDSFMAGGKDL